MIPALNPTATLERLTRRTIRVGVTGLARAGKTAFLTSVAANLLALGHGRPVLPALAARLAGRRLSVTVAPAGVSPVSRFDHPAHLAALCRDPPAWPNRTDAASLLALDLVLSRTGLAQAFPPARIRLELLDYPGEWLLDLPLLHLTFDTWSDQVLRRLESRPEAAGFLAFAAALPAGAAADEALAATGHRLYTAALHRLRDAGMALLQPGRFLMPAPGPAPAWIAFFPHRGSRSGNNPLHTLLTRRYDAYTEAARRDLVDPAFGRLDRLVVLVDLLGALSAGEAAFQDTRAALAAAAAALRWDRSVWDTVLALGRLQLPPPTIARTVFAATKSDHVGDRQRANLAALLRHVASPPGAAIPAAYHAMSAIRCTEDEVIELGERAVSGVVGRRVGDDRAIRFYPGEVPHEPPDPSFWRHRFLQMPVFEPLRPPNEGRGGVRNIGLDAVLLSLLDDVL